MLQLGQQVRYQAESGIKVATVIGWDKHTIYTNFIHPKDEYTQHPQWDDTFNLMIHVTRSFRIGFHRSRLVPDFIQLELFNQ